MKILSAFSTFLIITLSLLTSACQSSEAGTIVMRSDGCLYQGPQGKVGNSLTLTYNNQTSQNTLAVVVVTLKPGYSRTDLENYRGKEVPDFIDHFIAHLDATPGQTITEEIQLDPGKVNFIACAKEEAGILSILADLNPK